MLLPRQTKDDWPRPNRSSSRRLIVSISRQADQRTSLKRTRALQRSWRASCEACSPCVARKCEAEWKPFGPLDTRKGGAEMSQEDRKQSRSSKKAVRRKARRQAEAAQKLVSKLNPGLWNKYDTVKMMRDIQGAKAVTTATGARNQVGGNYSTSAKFFSQLQEPVTASVKSAGKGMKGDAKDTSKKAAQLSL
ncbi:unnamed protein product [Ectocarpus sp. 6 AP-2014]